MAVDTPQLALNPYKSEVPLVQIPQQDMQPGGPLPQQAGYMGKAGGAAALADNLLTGFMRGRAVKEQKKAQQANYAIDLSQKNEQAAWQTYQDSLRTGQAKPGDEKDPAYQAYIQAHHTTSQTMEKVAIPEEKPKGQKGQQKKKTDDDSQPKSFGEKLKDFMQGNPHLIPQLAITMRVPNRPVMTADTEKTKNTLAEQGNNLTLQGQEIEANKLKQVQDAQKAQDQAQMHKVDELGGIDAVASSKTAPPELVALARRGVSERLDKEGPDGQLRDKFAKDVLSGNSKNWTPADRQMAANLGYATQPKEVEMTGKNGHVMEVLVDPATNQQIPGSKPLDKGPPQWAQEFYGERAAKKRDIEKAVAGDPEHYGVTLTGDKKTDQARIGAAAMRLFTDHEEGIKAGVGTTGKTAYEVQRDNNILSDVAKEIKSRIPADKKDAPGKANFSWPGEKNPVMLSHEDAGNILNQFLTNPNETPGIYTFRNKPQLQQGKDAGAAERDRQWAKQLVKDRLMAAKGKAAMTDQQAEDFLKGTALGQPITPDEVQAAPGKQTGGGEQKKGAFSRFWDAGPFGKGEESKGPGGMTPPPTSGATAGGKYYMAPGMAGPVQLSDEDVAKAKAAHIPIEEVSPDILSQFQQ